MVVLFADLQSDWTLLPLVASSGCNLVALAASHLAVPVVCVTGLYKLCPMYPHEGQDTLQYLVSPVGTASVLEEVAKMAFRTQVLGNQNPIDQP